MELTWETVFALIWLAWRLWFSQLPQEQIRPGWNEHCPPLQLWRFFATDQVLSFIVRILCLNAHKEVANSGIPDETLNTAASWSVLSLCSAATQVIAGCFFTCLSLNAFVKIFFVFRSFSWWMSTFQKTSTEYDLCRWKKRKDRLCWWWLSILPVDHHLATLIICLLEDLSQETLCWLQCTRVQRLLDDIDIATHAHMSIPKNGIRQVVFYKIYNIGTMWLKWPLVNQHASAVVTASKLCATGSAFIAFLAPSHMHCNIPCMCE